LAILASRCGFDEIDPRRWEADVEQTSTLGYFREEEHWPLAASVCATARRVLHDCRMLRILLLDLGDTLVEGESVKPHVREALKVLGTFGTADGGSLELGLVSDYVMPGPNASATKLFNDYVALLGRLGLRPFFEPPNKRVTLSTQAGVHKPDRRIFELAVKRLGRVAPLSDCMFITENAEHVTAARQLGMTAWQFGLAFSDWAQGPLVVARALGLRKGAGFETALGAYLETTGQLKLLSLEGDGPGYTATVKRPYPVAGPDLGPLDGVHVELPARATLLLGDSGQVASLEVADPATEAQDEAHAFLAGLLARGAVARVGATPASATVTHEIASDAEGHPVLRRRGFSAV
jgi:beta-phosphoglucomutase-like phosphatase (HAD superfamily)